MYGSSQLRELMGYLPVLPEVGMSTSLTLNLSIRKVVPVFSTVSKVQTD